MKKVLLVRGLWGFIFSGGMDVIAAALNAAGIETEVWIRGFIGYGNLNRVVASAKAGAAEGKKIYLGGHSMGGVLATMAAEKLANDGIGVEVLGLFDACPPSHVAKIGNNVRHVLNFYQRGWGLKGETIWPKIASGFKGSVKERNVSTGHIYIDNDAPLQAEFIAAVKAH